MVSMLIPIYTRKSDMGTPGKGIQTTWGIKWMPPSLTLDSRFKWRRSDGLRPINEESPILRPVFKVALLRTDYATSYPSHEYRMDADWLAGYRKVPDRRAPGSILFRAQEMGPIVGTISAFSKEDPYPLIQWDVVSYPKAKAHHTINSFMTQVLREQINPLLFPCICKNWDALREEACKELADAAKSTVLDLYDRIAAAQREIETCFTLLEKRTKGNQDHETSS